MKCFNYVDQGCRCLNLDDKEKLDKVVKTTRLDSGVYVFFRDDRQKSETEDSYSSSTTRQRQAGAGQTNQVWFLVASVF